MDLALHLNKLESHFAKNAVCQVYIERRSSGSRGVKMCKDNKGIDGHTSDRKGVKGSHKPSTQMGQAIPCHCE